jgi:hypothetical protein
MYKNLKILFSQKNEGNQRQENKISTFDIIMVLVVRDSKKLSFAAFNLRNTKASIHKIYGKYLHCNVKSSIFGYY